MSEILSALTDGQATPEEVTRATAAWRDDPQARATWHGYQLIGDALRSPDLLQASDGAAFLQSFRARLAQEPVVLAPQAARVNHANGGVEVAPQAGAAGVQSAQLLKRRTWSGPAAVAASFVLLVGLMTSNLSGVGLGGGVGGGLSERADTMASLQKQPSPVWQSRSGGDFGLVASSLNSSLNGVPNNSLSAAPNRSQVQFMGASFNSQDQASGVLIRDPRVEPVLSLQRPMIIDPASTSFAEPGLIHQVGHAVDVVEPVAP